MSIKDIKDKALKVIEKANYCVEHRCGECKYRDTCPDDCNQDKTCRYCHEDGEGYVLPLDKNAHVYISPSNHTIRVKWYQYKHEVKINFCPICGRDMRGGE